MKWYRRCQNLIYIVSEGREDVRTRLLLRIVARRERPRHYYSLFPVLGLKVTETSHELAHLGVTVAGHLGWWDGMRWREEKMGRHRY